MSNTRKTELGNPTAERTADQSTQSASGLDGGRHDPPTTRDAEPDDSVQRERPAGERAPRRYDHADDPALPSDDAALGTKI